jgi:hypothetical protein
MECINPQCTHPCQGYPVPTARPGWIQGHKLEEDIICRFIRIAEITLLDMGLRRLNMLRCDMNLIHGACMSG